MKKSALALVAAFAIAFAAAPVSAKTKDSYRSVLEKYLSVTRTEEQLSIMFSNLYVALGAQFPGVPEEFWRKEGEKLSKEMFGDLVDAVEPSYRKFFTAADLKSFIKFYESPAGKKLAECTPALMQEGMAATQSLSGKYVEVLLGDLQSAGYYNPE